MKDQTTATAHTLSTLHAHAPAYTAVTSDQPTTHPGAHTPALSPGLARARARTPARLARGARRIARSRPRTNTSARPG